MSQEESETVAASKADAIKTVFFFIMYNFFHFPDIRLSTHINAIFPTTLHGQLESIDAVPGIDMMKMAERGEES